MAHASISHPTRGTLTFRQAQRDEDSRQAVTNIFPEIGTDRPPLVHVATRERERRLQGRVTAPRRARNDTSTSDWEQSLANYIDELEAHCDEFQGYGSDAYTFTDGIRSESFTVVFQNVEWTLTQGRPYDIDYELTLLIGRGVMESEAIRPRNPTVNTGMSVAATVDGNDLPGLRQMRVSRNIEYDVNAIYNKDTAENNDIVPTEGTKQQVVFEGTHTGTDSLRASADSTLQGLIGTDNPVALVTRFPGYTLSGFVTAYDSNLESRFGSNSHHFRLEFIEGVKA